MTLQVKALFISALILIPSPLFAMFMIESKLPLQYPLIIAYTAIFLACADFLTILLIEPYRHRRGSLTMSALLAAIAIIFLFVVSESLNRFVAHVSYGWFTPLVAAGVLLIYAAIFLEKNVTLKCQLSLSSVVLGLLWIAGTADKITMPF